MGAFFKSTHGCRHSAGSDLRRPTGRLSEKYAEAYKRGLHKTFQNPMLTHNRFPIVNYARCVKKKQALRHPIQRSSPCGFPNFLGAVLLF